MPKPLAVTTAERAYLERRLAPVLKALRDDRALCDEFLLFVRARGGGLSLTLERLKTVWWPSRRSMYPGFFVLALVEFGLAHELFEPERRRPPAKG
ncbi:MAG TPA: hypothetical protein VHD32_07935 [Candidatus Didemnitutus sp.]|nr:hypothetical protein [Candidatus Didemnitutus sp.]